MDIYYYLNPDHSYRQCSPKDWERQFHFMNRVVESCIVNGLLVSTVWSGIYRYPCSHIGAPVTPLPFETKIFDLESNTEELYDAHCSTWEEALEQHKNAIQWVLNGCMQEERGTNNKNNITNGE